MITVYMDVLESKYTTKYEKVGLGFKNPETKLSNFWKNIFQDDF